MNFNTIVKTYGEITSKLETNEEATEHALAQACSVFCLSGHHQKEVSRFFTISHHFFLLPNDALIGSVNEMIITERHCSSAKAFFDALLEINGPAITIQQAYEDVLLAFKPADAISPQAITKAIDALESVDAYTFWVAAYVTLVVSL